MRQSKLLAILAFIVLIILEIVIADNLFPVYVRNRPADTTIEMELNYSVDRACTSILFSDSQNIAIDNKGVGFMESNITTITSTPSFICEYQDNALVTVHQWNTRNLMGSEIIFNDVVLDNLVAETLALNGTFKADSIFLTSGEQIKPDSNASNACDGGEYLGGFNDGCILFNDTVKKLFAQENIVLNATSISTEVGTLTGGDITSIQILGDDETYNVTEVTGTPGFLININFTNVTNFNTVALRGKYTGGAGHTLALEILRVATNEWEERAEITDQMDFGVTTFDVFIGSNFINTTVGNGTVQFRINHDDNGISNHKYELDAVFVGQVAGLISGGDLSDLTGRDNACVLLPDVFCIDGSKNITGQLNGTSAVFTGDVRMTNLTIKDYIFYQDNSNNFIYEQMASGSIRHIFKTTGADMAISPVTIYNPNESSTASTGILFASGADNPENFTGGIKSLRTSVDDSILAFRVLEDGVVTLGGTDAKFYVDGNAQEVKTNYDMIIAQGKQLKVDDIRFNTGTRLELSSNVVVTGGNFEIEGAFRGARTVFQYGDITQRSADVFLKTTGNAQFSATRGIQMARPGSIVSHSTRANIATATIGDVTFEVRIDNSNQASLENEFLSGDGTGEKGETLILARNTVTFEIGDEISIFAQETGTMVWNNVRGYIEVQFDT